MSGRLPPVWPVPGWSPIRSRAKTILSGAARNGTGVALSWPSPARMFWASAGSMSGWPSGPIRTDPDWHRLSAGTGAQGPRLYDWAVLPYAGAAPGGSYRLLFRRSLEDPTEISFYLTPAPQGTRLETLVQVAGSRWTIEQCFEDAKQEVGLDEYEVRTWPSWHRHITLAMMAFAYLAVLHRVAIGGRAGPHDRGSGV